MTARQYTMKDSGVPWIGDVPEHWETIRLKFASWLKGRIGWQGLKSTEYTDKGPFLITGTDFQDGKINWDSCAHITEERFAEDSDIHIQEGDLLITKDGTIGKVAIAKNCPAQVSLNSGVMLIRNTKSIKYIDGYLYYTLLSDVFFLWYDYTQNGASTIKHLYQEQFYNFTFCFPPLPEQEAIAAYLDEKCGAIDGIIAEAKATIEEYKAWKASVIFEAVTKGLDPHAEMKDSGVEWIGKMPRHWDVCKLKFLCSMQAGKNLTTEDIQETGSYPVYGGNGVRGYYSEYNHESESLLVGRQGALCGNVHRVHGKYWATEHAVVTQPSTIAEIDFLYYLLIGMKLNQYASDAAAQPGLSVGVIRNIPVVLLPKHEQIFIASYLDRKCSAIDGIITEKQSLIDDLEAYKKSLIFETVTGKRRVFQGGTAI